MTSPAVELQGAIVAALKGSAPVTALIGNRVYDRVPSGAAFPYVSLGPVDELTEDADCVVGLDIDLQIDCWSREIGTVEVKRVADAVRRTLNDAALSLTDNGLVYIVHVQTRTITDPDGLTSHAVMTFNSFVEQPS